MWLENVNLNARREPRLTFVPAGGSVTLLADSSRVAIRLVWQFTAGMENPGPGSQGQARLTVSGRNNLGTSIQQTVAGISQYDTHDELNAEMYGQLLQGAFTVTNDSLLVDMNVIEMFRH